MEPTVKMLHEQRQKLWEASISNHQKYINPATNLFDEAFTEHRNCPVCNQNSYIEMFTKEGGRYVKCTRCSMVYINPVFTDEALEDYYRNNHALQGEIVENDNEFYLGLYNQGLDIIEQSLSGKGAVLDIGCSTGIFLDTARQRQWTTYGVELNETEAGYAHQKGHTVFNDLLENITFETQFDAVCMWDVFEHLKDGGFYLNAMKNLLKPDGVVFLQIPSADSLAAKILHDQCNMFDGLEHVNLYGVSTIESLARRSGFKLLNIQTVISEIGVINNYLNYENPYLGGTDNKETVMGLIDEPSLHHRLLGYKLQVVLGLEK